MDWLQALHAEANQSPARPRLPFFVQNTKIGSVEPVFIHHLALQANEYMLKQLLKEEQNGWHLVLGQADATTGLNKLADLLKRSGFAGAWRNEQLAVLGESGVQIGTIERVSESSSRPRIAIISCSSL